MLMSLIRCCARSLAVLAALAVSPAVMAALPDGGLYTTYSFSAGYTQVSFFVCGSLPQSEGCYGFGTLGPFGHVGAILEGDPAASGDTVKRAIYVVDIAGGSKGDQVLLYRYAKTDTVSAGFDQVSVTLLTTVALPLVGGANARCSIAGNAHFLYVGTDKSTVAAQIAKGSLAVSAVGGFGTAPLASITTNAVGDIVVAFGGDAGGIVVIGPDGQYLEDGGGASFTLTDNQGLSTQDLPTSPGNAANFNRSSRLRSPDEAPPTSQEGPTRE